MSDEDVEATNPFAPENVQQFILLTLLQIRDFVAITAKAEHPEGYNAVRANHRKGTLFLEAPYLLPQEGDDGESDNG